MSKLRIFGLLAICFSSFFALAQETGKPAKYIWTEHVTVAQGQEMKYPALAAQFRRAAETLNSDAYWLAASNLTGNMQSTIYVTFENNFDEIEKALEAFHKVGAEIERTNPNFMTEMNSIEQAPRSTIAKYVEELSYMPGKVPMPQAKWWQVTTIMVKPGHRTDFADLVQEEIELLKKAGIEESFVAYDVVMGLPSSGSAYYFVTPMKSLSEMDVDNSEKQKSVFTPMVIHKFESRMEQMVSSIESNLLMVRPDLSRAPKSFLAANPEFWTPKEPVPVLAKSKKAKKPLAEAIPPKQ